MVLAAGVVRVDAINKVAGDGDGAVLDDDAGPARAEDEVGGGGGVQDQRAVVLDLQGRGVGGGVGRGVAVVDPQVARAGDGAGDVDRW